MCTCVHVGRGTATSEGVAIAQSVIEYIHKAIGKIGYCVYR